MSIRHDHLHIRADEAVVFAELAGFTCSICAPVLWDVGRVVAFSEERMPSGTGARWVSIDKSTLGFGQPTPNRCNQYPDRMHYFMMRGET